MTVPLVFISCAGPATKSFANISLKDSGNTVIVPGENAKSEAEMTSHSSTTPSRGSLLINTDLDLFAF